MVRIAFSCWKKRNSVNFIARKRVPRRFSCSGRKQHSSLHSHLKRIPKPQKRQLLDPFNTAATALSILQAAAFHSTGNRPFAEEPVISVEENKHVFRVAQQVDQITESTGHPFNLMPLFANRTELHSSTIMGVQHHALLSQASAYLHNPRLQLLHWFRFFVLHCGTHHLLLHQAVLMQCSLVLVQYPLLMSFTQVLYGKRKTQVLSEAKRQRARKPSTSGTQTRGHALRNFYAADFSAFVFKRVKKMLAAENSRNKTAWTQTSALKRQSAASLLPTFCILSGLLSFVPFSSAGNWLW